MATVKELAEQNGFLAAQLTQVQQDLERYYLENLNLRQTAIGRPLLDDPVRGYWLQFHPREFWLDLRRETLHDNWYEAEAHGRWAGPEPVTVLSLPPLREGEYVMELELVGVIAPYLLESVRCSLLGAPIAPWISYLHPPRGLPALLGARFAISGDTQRHSLDLTLEFGGGVAPSENGDSPDLRRLTVCVRTLRIMDAALYDAQGVGSGAKI